MTLTLRNTVGDWPVWRVLLVPLGVVMLFSLVAPAVFADSYDGFDSYQYQAGQPSQVLFGAWNVTVDSGACWGSEGLFSSTTGAEPPRSAPNVVQFPYDSGCNGVTHTAEFFQTVNATSQSVNMTLYFEADASGFNDTVGTSSIFISVCGSSSNVATLNASSPASWTKISAVNAANQAIGSNCVVTISVFISANATGSLTVYFDDAVVTGGNPIVSPHNVILYNAQTHQTFNFLPYMGAGDLVGQYGVSGGTLQVQYTVSTSCSSGLVQISNVTCQQNTLSTSYAQIPLSAANLLTVHVGNTPTTGYYRSLIPTSTTLQKVYLDDVSRVVQYTFQVTDVSGTFGSGSIIRISVGGLVVTSGYLDSGHSFAAALVPNAYSLQLQTGSSLYSTTVNLEAPNIAGPSVVSISIASFVQPSSGGFAVNLGYKLAWSCNGSALIAFYTDTSGGTTALSVSLYNQTNTGVHLVGAPQTAIGSFGSTQFTFTGINSSQGFYTALFQSTDGLGVHYLGPVTVTLSNPSCPDLFPSILPSLPSFPISVMGLDQILPNANGYSEIIALTIIVLTAAVFSTRSSAIGGVVLAFEVLWFFLALFIPSTYTIIYTFLISAVVGFLRFRRHRTGLVGQ